MTKKFSKFFNNLLRSAFPAANVRSESAARSRVTTGSEHDSDDQKRPYAIPYAGLDDNGIRNHRRTCSSRFSTKNSVGVSRPLSGLPGEIQIDINQSNEKAYCLVEESPYHILKVAAQGNVDELRHLVEFDPYRLQVRDYRGQNVIHHAVSWSRTVVLDFLYSEHYIPSGLADINARDKLGNTPMHHAVEKNQMKALTWLLMHGANVEILNNQRLGAIHCAIELKNYDAVQAILKHSPQTVHLSGDLGFLPLHYACSRDLPEIARLLLSYGADVLRNCDVGYPAIHSATRNGSTNVIDVLLQHASKLGMTEKALIHVMDKEKNLPLHLAANSGDIRAVKVCLQAGADIDRLNDSDRQTAVHYAAAQGALDMIKEMFSAQPDKMEGCIHCRDIQDQTPLHKAAMFNHDDVVEYLIDMGASINSQDGERRTPLLLAASKNAVNAVKVLLKRRANTSLRDKENRNFLHLAIINNTDLRDIDLTPLKTLSQLLNDRDDFGRCPVHYASCAGQLATLERLLELGARVTLKDNDKQNPLHHSAARGRLRTCKKLLSSEHGSLLMNEIDVEGRTAVHVAARYGHFKVIALLVRKGALFNKDFHQNTPLHLAAENGHHETVVLLVGLVPHHLNARNASKNTPLHLAAMNGHALVVDYLMTMEATFEANDEGATFFDLAIANYHADVGSTVITHSRAEEAIQLPSTFGTPVIGLIQYLPKICLQLLDRCVTYSATNNKKSRDFFINYDFRYLQQQYDLSPGFKRRLGTNFKPLLPLETMARYNRIELLSHALSVTFLNQKWSRYGQLVYTVEVAFYVLFLALLTSVALRIDEQTSFIYHESQDNDRTMFSSPANFTSFLFSNYSNSTMPLNNKTSREHKLDTSEFEIELLFVVILCVINFTLVITRAFQQGLAFFFDYVNYVEVVLYVATILGFAPHLVQNELLSKSRYLSFCLGPPALLLGWFNLLLYMRRFDWFGLYVVMFVEVGKTLIRTLTIFSFIIIAFGIEFYIVFKTTKGPMPGFTTIAASLMTTFSMMASESQYVHIITPTLDGERELILGNVAYIVFVAFLILLPTLLMNLLVGLAVGDIQAIQKTANLKRLAMQVQFFSDLERRLPERFIRRFQITTYKHYPNRFRFHTLEIFRNLMGDDYSNDFSSAEIIGDLNHGAKSEYSYLIDELIAQSRKLRTLTAKLDSQHAMLKGFFQRLEQQDGSNPASDSNNDDEESDGEDFDVTVNNASTSSYTFSAARFAGFRRPLVNINKPSVFRNCDNETDKSYYNNTSQNFSVDSSTASSYGHQQLVHPMAGRHGITLEPTTSYSRLAPSPSPSMQKVIEEEKF